MIFKETPLAGAYIIDIEQIADDRGFFARAWCTREFKEKGLNASFVQCNISFNKLKGTLRGMHYQTPMAEAKLVRVTKGAIFKVIVDLRPNSITFKRSYSVELSAKNHKMIYIPEDFANGYMTLEPNTELFYQMSEFYYPEYSKGFRWNDPSFNIKWPCAPAIISERDNRYPDYQEI
jgi:dTDP-4-dehydrorhamnose 3,5-epimerase